MAERQRKRSPLKRWLALLFFALILTVLIIGGFWAARTYFPDFLGNQTNTSLITVEQTIQQTTIDKSGQTNAWDFAILIGVTIIIAIVLILLGYWFFKIISKRKLLSNKRKIICVARGIEELRKAGYEIAFEEAKQSTRFYGVDSDKNPTWTFVFFRSNVNPNADVSTVSKYDLISCYVDAKTLEVWGETHGKDLVDIKKEIHNQRFGKNDAPNYPGKTEREPVMADLFGKGSTVNVPLGEEEEAAEE